MTDKDLDLELIRINKGLKIQDVALVAGLPFNTVKNVEQNFPNVNYRTLSEICCALGVDINFVEKNWKTYCKKLQSVIL